MSLSKENGKIYVLCDPETGHVRYVGQTWDTLEARLWRHIRDSRGGTYHSHRWIQSLGEQVNIVLVEDGIKDQKTLDDREIFWIARMKVEGCELTNMELGGRGGIPCEETRRRHSERAKRVMNEPHQRLRNKERVRVQMAKPEEKARVSRETRARMKLPHEKERLRRQNVGITHRRWHEKRGIVNPNCPMCIERKGDPLPCQ